MNEKEIIFLIKKLTEFQSGGEGLKILNNSYTDNNDVFRALSALEETVVEFTNTKKGTKTISITIPQGMSVYGLFKNIQITSGTLIGYL